MIIEEIRKLVEEACKKESNPFGYGAWSHHIVSVVKYAKILAKKLNVDEEIVEIAALLHDYAGIVNKDWYPEHHIYSANLAEEILKNYNYPKERIEKIKHCILTHRATKNIQKETLEAEIIASADSMAHFDNVNSLLYLSYVKHKMDINEGTKWVLDKLERSWNKLIPAAKEILKDRYNAIKTSLSNTH
jgi:uncharacterized protein